MVDLLNFNWTTSLISILNLAKLFEQMMNGDAFNNEV